MSNISNHFFLNVIDDGTTLHGNLSSEIPLAQAWNGASAVPDWTVSTNQPLIYLTLLNGKNLVAPTTTTWYYNGVDVSSDSRFEITTRNVTYNGTTLAMPALRIVSNLASSANKDIDVITLEGTYEIDGNGIDFTATAQIRISGIEANGYIGLINFVNGISDITDKGQVITMYGRLYDPDGQSDSSVTTKWYLNDSTTGTNGASKTVDSTTYANAYQVEEEDVVDHATIRCEFYKDGNIVYTAYASVDDMQDPEFMYIQYNGNNGNAASLRKGDSATFEIWVGTRDDASVLGGTTNPTYPNFKIQLLDGSGSVITADIPGLPTADSNGWRSFTHSEGKISLTLVYDIVNTYGKNMTGIVVAYTS